MIPIPYTLSDFRLAESVHGDGGLPGGACARVHLGHDEEGDGDGTVWQGADRGHHLSGAEQPQDVLEDTGADHHERGAQEGPESVRRYQVRAGYLASKENIPLSYAEYLTGESS